MERITAEAISPVVQYTELVGALQGLAELSASASPTAVDGAPPAGKESAKLRSLVEWYQTNAEEDDAVRSRIAVRSAHDPTTEHQIADAQSGVPVPGAGAGRDSHRLFGAGTGTVLVVIRPGCRVGGDHRLRGA